MSGCAPLLDAAADAADRPVRDALLLTGATGFVGMELLARELQLTDRVVYALVRADSDEHAAMRLRETLISVFGTAEPYAERVRALAGNLTLPGLGLEAATALTVAESVSEIIHGAASVSFELALEQSRAINVQGSKRMLEFAALCDRHGGLRRFTHISTAYVAGEHRGVFGEDDLDVGQRFRNPYEQSKFEAELLMREHRERLPITVVRPSIVGDRHSGWTASFNVLYWPLRALDRGDYPILPARRRSAVDVVSVDYVADAIVALHDLPDAQGATYHLTASRDAITIGELFDLAVARFGCRRPPLINARLYRRVLHPLLIRSTGARRRRFLRATETYLPYFAMRVLYDNARTRAALHPAITPAPLAEYFDRLVDYAMLARWGRGALTRAGALDATPYAGVDSAAQRTLDRAVGHHSHEEQEIT